MDNPVGAIRYAIRQFRLSPVFTASAVLTLSLGIGGTLAQKVNYVNSVMTRVEYQSLPVIAGWSGATIPAILRIIYG
jgi:hypothetical protein